MSTGSSQNVYQSAVGSPQAVRCEPFLRMWTVPHGNRLRECRGCVWGAVASHCMLTVPRD